ncbi:MAG: pantetheine-phosphate adenylyltransferase [Anaerolineae bacterium]
MTIALYPATFDPIHNGHIDIAARAATLFDHVIVAAYARPYKNLFFTLEERLELMRETFKDVPNISIDSYNILTVDYARQKGAQVIVRGLRVISDFELEFKMALMNRKLAPDIEFVCLMTNIEYSYLSSSLLKEVAMLGADLSGLVPPHVAQALRSKFETLGEEINSRVEIVSLGDI